MSEADFVQSLFAPLTLGNAGAYGLQDDVAYLPPTPHGLIVTQDQIIEGTHFLPQDPLDMMARRLVRRNLSDMIAKGGIPTAAFLSLAWPMSRDRAGMAEFARGIGEDLAQLCGQCPLMGGDTSQTSGHLVASLTMLGRPSADSGQPVLRSGAQIGDVLAVTGVIGDSWLGLQAREGLFDREPLQACLQFSLAPCPPDVAIAPLIGRYAHASIDVSDGLILDTARLALASGLAITLNLDAVPLSKEAEAFEGVGCAIERATALASGGDDYQTLMAISPTDYQTFERACTHLNIRVSKVGTCLDGTGVTLKYDGADVVMPTTMGWEI